MTRRSVKNTVRLGKPVDKAGSGRNPDPATQVAEVSTRGLINSVLMKMVKIFLLHSVHLDIGSRNGQSF